MAARKRKAAAKNAAGKRKGAKAKTKPRSKDRPKPGPTIERTFKGAKHTVKVTADGFTYKGTEYRSLTAIAKKITGYPSVSGPRFFGTDAAGKKGGTK